MGWGSLTCACSGRCPDALQKRPLLCRRRLPRVFQGNQRGAKVIRIRVVRCQEFWAGGASGYQWLGPCKPTQQCNEARARKCVGCVVVREHPPLPANSGPAAPCETWVNLGLSLARSNAAPMRSSGMATLASTSASAPEPSMEPSARSPMARAIPASRARQASSSARSSARSAAHAARSASTLATRACKRCAEAEPWGRQATVSVWKARVRARWG